MLFLHIIFEVLDMVLVPNQYKFTPPLLDLCDLCFLKAGFFIYADTGIVLEIVCRSGRLAI